MKSLSYERLYYYLARLDELRESREDIGLRRARADGLITDLLRELAHVLSEDERILVLAIVGKHDRLWSVSSEKQAKLMRHDGLQPMERISLPPLDESQKTYAYWRARLQPLIDVYDLRWSQSPLESARRFAYGDIAMELKQRVSLGHAVWAARRSLREIKGKLSSASEKQKSELLEQKVIYEEFVSLYAGSE